MRSSQVEHVLLWCFVLNYAVLILWYVAFRLPHAWLYKLSGKAFQLEPDQFDQYNMMAIIFYKMAIILTCLVPYIALRIVG